MSQIDAMTNEQPFQIPDAPQLLVLPIPAGQSRGRRQGTRKKSGRRKQEVERKAGVLTTALANGMAQLQALICFVRDQLSGLNKHAGEAREWLELVENAMDDFELAIVSGHFERGSMTINDPELGSLDEALDCRPKWSRTKLRYPNSLLDFWLNEVNRRSRELMNLAIGSISIVDAFEVSKTVAALRYPIK